MVKKIAAVARKPECRSLSTLGYSEPQVRGHEVRKKVQSEIAREIKGVTCDPTLGCVWISFFSVS